MARKAISTRTRFEIFKRDLFTCQYCGANPPKVILHVDHITPVNMGGGNEDTNLVTSCQNCNLGKSDIPLSSVPKSLADKAADMKEAEAQLAGYAQIFRERNERIEDECWEIITMLSLKDENNETQKIWFNSIKNFLGRMGFFEAFRAAEITAAKSFNSNEKAFKYFCGTCWGIIRSGENG